jgi:hypothetical protein
MSIRPALQAAASPSDGSIDLAGPEGRTLPRVGIVRLSWQPCPLKVPVFMQGDEFPPNRVLGNPPSPGPLPYEPARGEERSPRLPPPAPKSPTRIAETREPRTGGCLSKPQSSLNEFICHSGIETVTGGLLSKKLYAI